MTANELNILIDILERRGEDRQLEAATMLRQQQAEIEALKSDTIPYKDLHQVVKNVLAGGTPDSELAEHKRIIREQQAEIEELKTIRGNSILVPSDKLQSMQVEIETLKKARCVACGWNLNLIGGEK